jgi:hypothetical protein
MMASKDDKKANTSAGSGKGRLQIFVAGFAVEGSDSVLADGFKAIRDLTEAMKQSGALAPAPRSRPVLNTGSETPKPAAQTLELFETEQSATADEQSTEEIEAAEPEETPSNGNAAGPKRAYNYKTPTFLNELDITTAKKDLKAFMAEKNPPNATAKYLAAVYWLQKYKEIPEVTIDHVYTVFDILGWKADMAINPSAPLRDLKSKSHMLTREPGAEGYKLNFKGEQEVEKMK